MAEKYITQVSEEVECRVTKKLSREFSRTESRILGAFSKLDDFLLNPQVRSCSVAVPGTSRNINSENRKPTGDRSLNDPCREVVCSACHTSYLNDSEQEETHHKNFCKILQKNALYRQTLARSCKICLDLAKFLQELCVFCKIFAIVVFSSDESLSQCFCYRLKRITYLHFKVSRILLQKVEGILQSIRNQAFRVGSENDRNDLIQKHEIK